MIADVLGGCYSWKLKAIRELFSCGEVSINLLEGLLSLSELQKGYCRSDKLIELFLYIVSWEIKGCRGRSVLKVLFRFLLFFILVNKAFLISL